MPTLFRDKVAKASKRSRKCTSAKAVLLNPQLLRSNPTSSLRNSPKRLVERLSKRETPKAFATPKLSTARQYRCCHGNHVKTIYTPWTRPFIPLFFSFSDKIIGNLAKPLDPNGRRRLFGAKTSKYLNSLEGLAKRAKKTFEKVKTDIKASVKDVLDKQAKLKLKNAQKVHEKVHSRRLPHPRFFPASISHTPSPNFRRNY